MGLWATFEGSFSMFWGAKNILATALKSYIKWLLYIYIFFFLKKVEKVEKTGIISSKFSLRCTPSVILGRNILPLRRILFRSSSRIQTSTRPLRLSRNPSQKCPVYRVGIHWSFFQNQVIIFGFWTTFCAKISFFIFSWTEFF